MNPSNPSPAKSAVGHTPGPWCVNRRNATDCTIIDNHCKVIARLDSGFPGEVGANAHLIAASPMMYEALKAAVHLAMTAKRDAFGKLYEGTVREIDSILRNEGITALNQAEGK